MPGFQKVYLAYEDKGFAVIAVAINDITPADVKALGILFPVVVANDRVRRDYGDIANPPVSFLIGRDGRIIKKVKNLYGADELKRDVERALQGP
jgi:glutathione peroxidase-family protein